MSQSTAKAKDEFWEEDLNILNSLKANQAFIEFHTDGTIVKANDNFLSAMGYTLQEIQGKHHQMFVEAEYGNSLEYKQFWKDLADGNANQQQFTRVKKNGEMIYLSASYIPVKNQKGEVCTVVKFAIDITEQKMEMLDLQSKFNAVSRAQAVIEFELDGTILDANENFLATLGYSLNEIQGSHHRMFVSPEYASSHEYTQMWHKLSRGEVLSGQFERFDKQGNSVWIQASYNPILDLSGKPYKVVKFATNITEQKIAAQRALERQAMIDKSPINTMLATPDGTLVYMNENSRVTLKKLESELPDRVDNLVGKSIDWFHKNPSHQKKMIADPSNFPYRTIIDVGHEKLDLLVSAIMDPDGNYVGPMVTWDVVTAKYELVRELNESSDHLTSSADTMSEVAANLSAGAEETSSQANTASVASEEVNSGVQSVASSMEEMSSAVKEITQTTNEASHASNEAMNLANSTNEIITKLGDSSKDIGNVIKVISSIAQQTNLLALNATIEAARAGEAGKGFAVVANEVKELAKQTAHATEDITAKISAIQVDSGEAVNAIGEIREAIEKVNGYAANIASSVEEQAATTNDVTRIVSESAESVNQISQNISQVSEAAQNTGKDANKAKETSDALQQLALSLKESIKKLNV